MRFWMESKNKENNKKDWLTLFSFWRNFQMSLVDNGNFLWSFQRKRSLFFLKLSATEDSIENVSRNKLRCANFLAGRFTILEGALSARLLFSLVMAPINGATHPPLFLFLSSLFLSAHPQGESFSVFAFTLFSLLTRKGKNLFLYSLSLRSLAERIFFCKLSHSFSG